MDFREHQLKIRDQEFDRRQELYLQRRAEKRAKREMAQIVGGLLGMIATGITLLSVGDGIGIAFLVIAAVLLFGTDDTEANQKKKR